MFSRKTKNIEAQNSVADLIKINIGKFEQWVLIRAENKNNPILLFCMVDLEQPISGLLLIPKSSWKRTLLL
ncbi:hypothetical protein K9O30_22685 [Clostridium bowmanii]|uniref:hypothetical protein n=1 Tax=Clostridium bowmanii TaxID=132925 RepID=UPI001C0DDF13|nr:hypothetical protein [Clostridium bowmanii]MBU3192271.1 hypothetical protein [Clostridium bowmanii]MCA1076461.1 hypothetical protein [Clostridium bowmanii]